MKWIFIVFAVASTCAEANPTFTYEDLVSLIQNKNLKNVEEVIAELPQDLRSNYTLMYQSRSLQQATSLNPRAILFGKEAQFILAFNGEENEIGFQTLECIQFRSTERSFDFRQISFPTAQNGLKEVEFSERNKSSDGKVSCTSCHGDDPRPNWDHYSSWPGAYGGSDDVPEGMYANFVKVRDAHPIYKWLIQGSEVVAPYMGTANIYHRPNLRFSDTMGTLNALRASRILEEKLTYLEQLGFALGGIQCQLAPEQTEILNKAGVTKEKINATLDRGTLFNKLGLRNNELGTQIFNDDSSYVVKWDHQSGYGYLAEYIGMLQVKKLADEGNTILKNSLAFIETNLRKYHQGDELDFFLTLNKNAPYIDTFSDYIKANRNSVCPELTNVFVNEFLGNI